MKRVLLIIVQLASASLFAQVSNLDVEFSGNLLHDPYLSGNDQTINGNYVREFSSGYSDAESLSAGAALNIDYASYQIEWLHMRGRLSFGQLSASNDYQYYATQLASLGVGVGLDLFKLFDMGIKDEFELQALAEGNFNLYNGKMWFTSDGTLQNVVEGFAPGFIGGIQFKYRISDRLALSVAPEGNFLISDAIDGWVDQGFATSYFSARLGVAVSLD